ncbi:benzoate 4-monooxygenase cytochrome P450 [Penicillium robsamsonii]|uniref:benzoate 4-monooxygenase cytochrome P450 n=1 Tax=Penicillium robsamsonii TaxID=1792511 RepID=UPI0025486606|nr:benzoate 4-monooxygenase cytochrome P450 [Penicillium robsamsonii]KAJ5837014.1 benzoate 4-monooxygenase cytochrome P450 [Penicillium robsamsonii]
MDPNHGGHDLRVLPMLASNENFARLTTAFGAGIAAHLIIFRRGEWDVAATKIPVGLFILQICIFSYYLLVSGPSTSIYTALWLVGQITLGLIAGITVSILSYRAFFHRLNSFPGPFPARLSMWYVTSLYARNPDAFNTVRGLHQQYGDFVRTGPTELSVNHPDALQAVHSGRSECTKGPWYSMLHPFISLFAIRDKAEHSRRRKPWELAFRPNAVLEYLPALEKGTNELLEQVERRKGKPMDMTYWINLFTFDLTGRIAFSQEYECVKHNKKHPIMEINDSSNLVTGVVSHVVWLISFIKATPVLNANMKALIGFSEEQVQNRQKMQTSGQRDVFSWLWEDFKEQGKETPQSKLDLVADASLVIFAGSGTVAVTIIGCLYFLTSNSPDYLAQIRQDLDKLDEINSHSLSQVHTLNAVINETLRLHYPALSGFQRQTPPGGLHIAGRYIPGNTNIKIPFYTLFRDERNFAEPEKFIPERWTTRKELVKNPEAFAPFLLGPYNCLGKSLALMQVRHVLVELIQRYEIVLAPGADPEKYWKERTDGFVMGLAPLELSFTERKIAGF